MKILIFALMSLFFFKMSLAATSCPEDQLSTHIDFEHGQIQRVCKHNAKDAGYVVYSSTLKAEDMRYEDKFNLMDTSQKGLTKAQIKTANLLNLEEKWIRGKRYVIADGLPYPVDIKETLYVTKYLAEAKQGKKMNQPTVAEEAAMDESINNLKGAIQKNLDNAIAAYENLSPENAIRKRPGESDEEFLKNVEHLNKLTKKDYELNEPFTKAIDAVSVVATTSSTIVVTMVDGNPSAYPMKSLSYSGPKGAITGATLNIKTVSGNLYCSAMSQENNMPPNLNVVQVDWNFAPMTLFQYSCQSGTCIALVDTNTTNNICSATADRIFKDSFDNPYPRNGSSGS